MSNNENVKAAYEVLDLEGINKIETEKLHQIKRSYILDYNGAFITVYNDGSAVVRPPILGEKEGLVFYDLDAMEKMIASRAYPVKGNDTFWEVEKERVLDLAGSMPYYCAWLSEMMGFKTELNSNKAYLAELSAAAKEALTSKKIKKKDKEFLRGYLSIYIVELLRQKVGGQWKLKPVPFLNVYYVPEIVKGNKYASPWKHLGSRLKTAGFMPVDIEELVESSNEFYPAMGRNYSTVA